MALTVIAVVMALAIVVGTVPIAINFIVSTLGVNLTSWDLKTLSLVVLGAYFTTPTVLVYTEPLLVIRAEACVGIRGTP